MKKITQLEILADIDPNLAILQLILPTDLAYITCRQLRSEEMALRIQNLDRYIILIQLQPEILMLIDCEQTSYTWIEHPDLQCYCCRQHIAMRRRYIKRRIKKELRE